MSENKDEDPVDTGENSDRSLSDSWTILNSSHFKDDGDLSDAESVEVLASEELLDDDTKEKCHEQFTSDVLTTLMSDSCDQKASVAATIPPLADASPDISEVEEIIAPPTEVDGSFIEDERQEGDWVPGPEPITLKNFWKNDVVRAFAHDFARLFYEVCIYFLLIFLIFSAITMSCSFVSDQSNFSIIKNTKSFEQYEMDPLSLQLSHVLAEWKKQPLEDHSLDRHLLKTLLLYYGGSTELSANLFSLTEKVQKHNEVIKRFSKKEGTKNTQHQQMIVSGHLAHSIACILGKQDNDRSIPVELFTTAHNGSDEIDAFAPEPGFWLNDWHLPKYLKANETFYRVDTKPVVPPMRNLFLHLGSAKWNQYFWKLYHQDEKNGNESKTKPKEVVNVDEVHMKAMDQKIAENDLEREETERSPLDDANAGDFISVEESSGNIDNIPETPDDENDPMYPLFVNSLVETVDNDLDEDESDYKLEEFGNFFEVLDRNKYFANDVSYHSRYECSDESCRQFQKMNAEKSEGADGPLKSKLTELFDENAFDKLQTEEALDGKVEDFTLTKLQKEKKSKGKGGKRKYSRSNLEGSKTKSKQKKKEKQKLNSEENSYERKKKLKMKDKKKKSAGSELQYYSLDAKGVKENYVPEGFGEWSQRMYLNREKLRAQGEKANGEMWLEDEYYNVDTKARMKKNYVPESFGEWSERMYLNREKLRALSEKGNDQIWVFERARARREMREETFAE